MNFWLQKQGEKPRSLTDSTPIVSGIYRIIALTDKPFRDLEIRIERESPEISDRQTKYVRSDANGYMEIFPYSELTPGTWKISCYGDILSELQGNYYRESLCLQIIPPATRYLEELERLIQGEIEPLLTEAVPTEKIKLQFANIEDNSSFVFELSLPETKKSEKPIELPEPVAGKSLQYVNDRPTSLPPKLNALQSYKRDKNLQLPSISR